MRSNINLIKRKITQTQKKAIKRKTTTKQSNQQVKQHEQPVNTTEAYDRAMNII